MATVTGHYRIVTVARGQRTYDAGLSAVRKMSMTAHRTRMFQKRALDALFELADSGHLGIDPDESILSEILRFSPGLSFTLNDPAPRPECQSGRGLPRPAPENFPG